jgi:hypothetical protein
MVTMSAEKRFRERSKDHDGCVDDLEQGAHLSGPDGAHAITSASSKECVDFARLLFDLRGLLFRDRSGL